VEADAELRVAIEAILVGPEIEIGEAGGRFLAALERAFARLPLTIEGARAR